MIDPADRIRRCFCAIEELCRNPEYGVDINKIGVFEKPEGLLLTDINFYIPAQGNYIDFNRELNRLLEMPVSIATKERLDEMIDDGECSEEQREAIITSAKENPLSKFAPQQSEPGATASSHEFCAAGAPAAVAAPAPAPAPDDSGATLP